MHEFSEEQRKTKKNNNKIDPETHLANSSVVSYDLSLYIYIYNVKKYIVTLIRVASVS